MYKGEGEGGISDVIDLYQSITDTIAAIFEDVLPEDFAQQIITTVLATSSSKQSNVLFIKFCHNLFDLKL